jgi:hypothetical protein
MLCHCRIDQHLSILTIFSSYHGCMALVGKPSFSLCSLASTTRNVLWSIEDNVALRECGFLWILGKSTCCPLDGRVNIVMWPSSSRFSMDNPSTNSAFPFKLFTIVIRAPEQMFFLYLSGTQTKWLVTPVSLLTKLSPLQSRLNAFSWWWGPADGQNTPDSDVWSVEFPTRRVQVVEEVEEQSRTFAWRVQVYSCKSIMGSLKSGRDI